MDFEVKIYRVMQMTEMDIHLLSLLSFNGQLNNQLTLRYVTRVTRFVSLDL